MKKQELLKLIESSKARSAWTRGVKEYAIDLIDRHVDLDEFEVKTLKKTLLDGAINWHDFSYGGCSLISNFDIAERLCNPTELKITKGGLREPNSQETWLDCQARALYQAYLLIESYLI